MLNTNLYSDLILYMALAGAFYLALDRFFFPTWQKDVAFSLLKAYRKKQALRQYGLAYDQHWQTKHLLEPETHPLALGMLIEASEASAEGEKDAA